MQQHNYSLRDLYRIMEESPDNPVSNIQDEMDLAVMEAYGMKKNDDILAFLLELNHKVSEKEKKKEKVTGPGLPDYVKDRSEYISSDCVMMK